MASDENFSLEEALKQAAKVSGSAPNDQADEQKVVAFSSAPVRDAPPPFYESFNLMVKDFNRFFIQTLIGNVPHVIWEHDNEDTFFSYENFHKQFSYVKVANNLFGESNKIESGIKATKYWLDNYHKRSCKGIKFWPSLRFDPNDPEGKYHNTWKG
jgi:hypothetical protein